ncbi:MAG: 23S rRNA (guanosine(2251)-2'-O)-methyltransferase RlmB [Candidatus Omnitrophica bacterium]|nr:23S rRNA (guanosine(2251)-2'-O)-methyltransferase RlmB [Candidatus Omnitrophota bacterium]MDD5351962.1 23S rRNA (guanosine(2251)-2'-O)-methyltransferase RlmB [Candidatus Omnitrophota bacterium]MDD5550788.1 23S rRNA (guanosine(2251)-2'-O)-methyltransferase RlmB [Candidatus Omnitrophota bacterium]
MLLYGKNSILQRLKTNPQSIIKIFLDDVFDDSYILDIASKKRIPIIRLRRNEFLRLKRADCLQGIIAEVNKFSYVPFRELLDKGKEENLSFVFLDSISDPQNLGAIIRTCACFGGFAVVLPKHYACEVTDTVLHVASGGENFVPVSMVTNLSTALIEAKDRGYWAAGAVVEEGQDLNKTELPFPLCIVLGSEGKGIRQGLQNQLDLRISLPMIGASLSFNVSIACAIFCYEIIKQKSEKS